MDLCAKKFIERDTLGLRATGFVYLLLAYSQTGRVLTKPTAILHYLCCVYLYIHIMFNKSLEGNFKITFLGR
jgi:hypothetical protein